MIKTLNVYNTIALRFMAHANDSWVLLFDTEMYLWKGQQKKTKCDGKKNKEIQRSTENN